MLRTSILGSLPDMPCEFNASLVSTAFISSAAGTLFLGCIDGLYDVMKAFMQRLVADDPMLLEGIDGAIAMNLTSSDTIADIMQILSTMHNASNGLWSPSHLGLDEM